MGLIDRHKKPGAFRKLIQSLEVTAPEKRAKIIQSFREEDSEFAREVEECILTFEELIPLSDSVICEIMFVANMKNLAYALYKAPAEVIEKFKKNIPPKKQLEFRDETDAIGELRVAEQMSAKFRIVETARLCEDQGLLKIKPMNPKYP